MYFEDDGGQGSPVVVLGGFLDPVELVRTAPISRALQEFADESATDYGTGLQGMADRLDALGGTLEVRSGPGQGTTVMGRLRTGS